MKKCEHEYLEILNRMAQGGLSGLEQWLDAKPADEIPLILSAAVLMADQAGVEFADIERARDQYGPKGFWMVRPQRNKEPIRALLARLRSIHAKEHRNAIRLLLGIFVIADRRRRNRDPLCSTGKCSHWWHHS